MPTVRTNTVYRRYWLIDRLSPKVTCESISDGKLQISNDRQTRLNSISSDENYSYGRQHLHRSSPQSRGTRTDRLRPSTTTTTTRSRNFGCCPCYDQHHFPLSCQPSFPWSMADNHWARAKDPAASHPADRPKEAEGKSRSQSPCHNIQPLLLILFSPQIPRPTLAMWRVMEHNELCKMWRRHQTPAYYILT